ncbi:tyrosine-type recombinase/integrase [Geomicrobium sediminis]|uniref:Integrase/recombinase XerD n=1 Tax=Geomicrobium sediminis TaxID=1347788 RepID=A0ABS2PHK3_9BACL|nr:tyrosine-type recombinase/integrase [Geomicrobium sediminis]MBM7634928.1 integrase/recombinase XerD [Geomicrobium sediminis]
MSPKRRSNQISIPQKQRFSPTDFGPKSLDEAIHLFLRECKIRNLRQDTLIYYKKELDFSAKLLRNNDAPEDPNKITASDINDSIILFMMDQKLKETTINTRLRAVRTLFNFLDRKGFLENNPMKEVKLLRNTKRIVETFTRDQIRTLFAQPDQETFTGMRDYTLMMLFLETGVRLNEMANIKVDDIKWQDGVIYIRHPKTQSHRSVPIQLIMKKQLSKYVQLRGQLNHDFLFVNIDNEPMLRQNMQQSVRKYGRMACILNVRCSPHTFRHTFAKMCVQNGADVFTLQTILGHSTMDMVRHYVNLYSNDLTERHRKFSPIQDIY